jgi:hypothetical protein
MQVADVRKLIDGLRWDRRGHPYRGRREYSQCAQAVAAEATRNDGRIRLAGLDTLYGLRYPLP